MKQMKRIILKLLTIFTPKGGFEDQYRLIEKQKNETLIKYYGYHGFGL